MAARVERAHGRESMGVELRELRCCDAMLRWLEIVGMYIHKDSTVQTAERAAKQAGRQRNIQRREGESGEWWISNTGANWSFDMYFGMYFDMYRLIRLAIAVSLA